MAAGRRRALAGLVLVGLPGCSSAPAPVDPTAPTVLLSGWGDGSGADAQITGPVTLDEKRCVGIDGHLVIWPQGTSWDSGADALTLPNGNLRRVGDAVSGGGYFIQGTSAQSSLADIEQRTLCAWDGETAIFNPGSDVAATS